VIDNIFIMLSERVFQQTVGIHMATNCASPLADLFRYSYEAEFIQGLLKKNEKMLAIYIYITQSFNFMFCYIDDVLSLTNSRFWWFFYRIYSIGIEIKDISDTDRSVSHLDLHIKTESEGRLRTNLYDKRDHINFPIVILSFYLYVAAFRQRLHVEYISLSWSDIAELVIPIRMSW
jgi:hypothetical protein